MILFFDTETSGLVNFSAPVDHPAQPHIVQLAALLCRDDEECTIVKQYVALIKPDGWYIEEAAHAVHGISNEHAFKFGEPIEVVMRAFYSLVEQCVDGINQAESSGRIIGHNVSFDIRMALREAYELRRFEPSFINQLTPFCTMRAMTARCRLPHPHRLHSFKWPKLSEAYKFMFDTTLEGAHSALIDVLACRDLFVEGRKREWWR